MAERRTLRLSPASQPKMMRNAFVRVYLHLLSRIPSIDFLYELLVFDYKALSQLSLNAIVQ